MNGKIILKANNRRKRRKFRRQKVSVNKDEFKLNHANEQLFMNRTRLNEYKKHREEIYLRESF